MPDSEAPGLRLIAGLGNPGREYEGTRHNAGFAVLDELASRLGVSFAKEPKWDAQVAKVPGRDLVLLKPATFMNLSGEAVAGYARFYRIPHASVLVVADDVALPPGTIRLRREGGSGGQKGLESVLVHFATEQVPRLRIGVGGASSGADLAGHVLSRFRPEELPVMGEAVARSAEAVLCAAERGPETAMDLYNALPVPDESQHQQTEQP
jgi:PTH1 family peptidyl-tRNA hydrolase